ncbi:hypothetical protein HHL11_10445 [Ramlibacter sp. G-1-2-2]|uniref:Tetratricopeptide repeat protein n=1 Tax=Ramlibacter agri TaxID=2728837 RepID=A0A848H4K9_9BURK|nr:hypothetical protein [Ramlibacter agri]NML44170.1 hypothetical protein [Ramlibacter agri]
MNPKRLIALLLTLLLVLFGAAARAQAAEPTVHDIYQAADAGDLQRARTLVDQVLEKHPNSAKAHYVKAEIAARQQDAATARSELQNAERIAPGLPFAKPEAAAALRSQVSHLGSSSTNSVQPQQRVPQEQRRMGAPPSGGFGLGGLLVLGVIVIAVIAIFKSRRRPAYGPYQQPGAPDNNFGRYDGGVPQQPWGGQPYGYGNVPPAQPQPGLGSTLGRGLATGLAVGAGAVAAQEIGRRMFEHGNGQQPAMDNRDLHGGSGADSSLARDAGLGSLSGDRDRTNADFGGNDFGIADNGSWDDGGGSFDGGGSDDWN